MIVTLTMNPALDIATAIERLVPDHKLRCTAPLIDPGGGGINVARTIHKLGSNALAIFPAGGATGARLAALLASEGVSCAVIPIAGETRESFAVTDRAIGRTYRFVLPGPALSSAEQDACRLRVAAIEPVPPWLVLSGSLPPEVPGAFYADLVREQSARGIKVAVDSSGDALAACAGAGAFILKPSLAELASLVGRPITDETDEETAAHGLIDRAFARHVIVSLGARGALWVSATRCQRFAAPKVPTVSAIGAGDAMLAGIVLALSRDAAMSDAIRYGIAAGAAAATAPGTGLADPALVARLCG